MPLDHRRRDGASQLDDHHRQARAGREAKFAQLNTLSHEFVHSWNVERLRPAELEPFDFTRANPTPSLWVAEGFTQYYGPLADPPRGRDVASTLSWRPSAAR